MRLLSKNADTGEISIVNGQISVLFRDDAHFNFFYPSLDLSGKNKISYEIDRFNVAIHIDVAGGVSKWIDNPKTEQREEMRVPEYEALIDAVPSLFADLNDEFFGLDFAAAKALKKRELKKEGMDLFEDKWPYFDVLLFIADTGADKTEILADYNAFKSAFIAARNAVNAVPDTGNLAVDIQNVKDVTAAWPAI